MSFGDGQTDRQTHRQTDGQSDHNTSYHFVMEVKMKKEANDLVSNLVTKAASHLFQEISCNPANVNKSVYNMIYLAFAPFV